MVAKLEIRPGEVVVEAAPAQGPALAFIGQCRTPWRTPAQCPRRGDPLEGPLCRIEVDPLWEQALDGIEEHSHLQILYWMHLARRDLALQAPRGRSEPIGTFAIRSPNRPNPVASSVVAMVRREGRVLHVRGLDCLDGTPLVDIKPHIASIDTPPRF